MVIDYSLAMLAVSMVLLISLVLTLFTQLECHLGFYLIVCLVDGKFFLLVVLYAPIPWEILHMAINKLPTKCSPFRFYNTIKCQNLLPLSGFNFFKILRGRCFNINVLYFN